MAILVNKGNIFFLSNGFIELSGTPEDRKRPQKHVRFVYVIGMKNKIVKRWLCG